MIRHACFSLKMNEVTHTLVSSEADILVLVNSHSQSSIADIPTFRNGSFCH